jgi:hypothetical protein
LVIGSAGRVVAVGVVSVPQPATATAQHTTAAATARRERGVDLASVERA